MKISISRENARLLQDQVDEGKYDSIEEALDEAVRLLVEHEGQGGDPDGDGPLGVADLDGDEFAEYDESEIDDDFDESDAEAIR